MILRQRTTGKVVIEKNVEISQRLCDDSQILIHSRVQCHVTYSYYCSAVGLFWAPRLSESIAINNEWTRACKPKKYVYEIINCPVLGSVIIVADEWPSGNALDFKPKGRRLDCPLHTSGYCTVIAFRMRLKTEVPCNGALHRAYKRTIGASGNMASTVSCTTQRNFTWLTSSWQWLIWISGSQKVTPVFFNHFFGWQYTNIHATFNLRFICRGSLPFLIQ